MPSSTHGAGAFGLLFHRSFTVIDWFLAVVKALTIYSVIGRGWRCHEAECDAQSFNFFTIFVAEDDFGENNSVGASYTYGV